MKGDRLRPLRSAQAVAVHQDGIGGRGHPVERCRFFPDQAKFGAVRRRHGLRPRRSGPRRFDARRRAVRKLRGRTDPSRAFGGIKGATTRLTAPAYWKFESSPLQQRVCLSLEFACRAREAGLFAPVCGPWQRRGRQRRAEPADMALLATNISGGPNSSTAPPRLNTKPWVLAPRHLAMAVEALSPGRLN
jgi:hypothetical protein